MKLVVKRDDKPTFKHVDEVEVSFAQFLNSDNKAYCITLVLGDCLDFVDLKDRDKVLGFAIEKLRLGGQLEISGIDLLSLAANMTTQTIQLNDAQTMLYGDGRKSADTLTSMQYKCLSAGLKLIKSKVTNGIYSIILERPNNE